MLVSPPCKGGARKKYAKKKKKKIKKFKPEITPEAGVKHGACSSRSLCGPELHMDKGIVLLATMCHVLRDQRLTKLPSGGNMGLICSSGLLIKWEAARQLFTFGSYWLQQPQQPPG